MEDGPLDPFDPRFDQEVAREARQRLLVASRGPGSSPEDPKVRILRLAVPLLALAGVLTVIAVFFAGLSPGGSTEVVGPVDDVRDAVADRPRRVCLRGANPCAWLTVVDDRLLALNTSGPLPPEFGRQGVGWCPTSGYFGANATGSRYDLAGRVVRGPAIRGLDRFDVVVDARGRAVINFASLTAGPAEWQTTEVLPPAGPDCEPVPFDRDPDLRLTPSPAGSAVVPATPG